VDDLDALGALVIKTRPARGGDRQQADDVTALHQVARGLEGAKVGAALADDVVIEIQDVHHAAIGKDCQRLVELNTLWPTLGGLNTALQCPAPILDEGRQGKAVFVQLAAAETHHVTLLIVHHQLIEAAGNGFRI
jgi:hypothetical protein